MDPSGRTSDLSREPNSPRQAQRAAEYIESVLIKDRDAHPNTFIADVYTDRHLARTSD